MGYIFETEIDIIRSTVRGRTIGEDETIRLRDILASDIHPAIKAYFKAEVEQILQQERESEVRSKKLPYALPEIARLHRQIDLLLVLNYQFGQHDFEGMLDHAVHFQFNFLCRPQWTLLGFIFESNRRRSTAEIDRKLRYLLDYIYYSEIIKRYIEERGLAEMTYEEFSALIEKIDREIVSTHTSVELALMARPIVRFMEAGRPASTTAAPEPSIPINAAIVFFEDKKLDAIKERLETERDRNGLDELTLHQLANFIEKVQTGNEDAEVSFPSFKPRIATPGAEASSTPDQDRRPAPEGETRTEAPRKSPVKVFSDFDDVELPETSHENPAGSHAAGEHERSPAPDAVPADIYTLFSLSEQKMFTKKVFRKDEVEFRNALDRLNGITGWQEASSYLSEIFLSNDVDPFSEEAILFTDRVQSYYLPTDDREQ